MNLHWDGNNVSLEERNRSAAMGTGITPPTGDRQSLKRVADWLRNLAAPPYPFKIDKELAGAGRAGLQKILRRLPRRQMARISAANMPARSCRSARSAPTEHRLDSYTYDVAVNQNMIFAGYANERFRHFRKTFGYANSPLDGLWLRAPYLHNGSVPTLRDLLEPSDKRPKSFYRGYDVYDQKKVGFVADVAEERGRPYFRLQDTTSRATRTRAMRARRMAPNFRRRTKTLWSSISRPSERLSDGAARE